MDDDPNKRGKVIHGLPVFGGNGMLHRIVTHQKIEQIVISSPSITEERINEILRECEAQNIELKRMAIRIESIGEQGLPTVAVCDAKRRFTRLKTACPSQVPRPALKSAYLDPPDCWCLFRCCWQFSSVGFVCAGRSAPRFLKSPPPAKLRTWSWHAWPRAGRRTIRSFIGGWAQWRGESLARATCRRRVREFEVAVRLSPNDFRYWEELGRALEMTGDRAGAEKALRRAVFLAPNYYHPHWRLGNLLLRSNRYEEAFQHLFRAAEAQPGTLAAGPQPRMAGLRRRRGSHRHRSVQGPECARAFCRVSRGPEALRRCVAIVEDPDSRCPRESRAALGETCARRCSMRNSFARRSKYTATSNHATPCRIRKSLRTAALKS